LVSKDHLEKLIAEDGAVAVKPIVFNIASEDADTLGGLLTFGRVVGHV